MSWKDWQIWVKEIAEWHVTGDVREIMRIMDEESNREWRQQLEPADRTDARAREKVKQQVILSGWPPENYD